MALAALTGEAAYRGAEAPVVLAKLSYLLGISGFVSRPTDFPPHCLLGMAGTFDAADPRFMVVLCCEGGPFVCEEDDSLVAMAEEPELLGHQFVEIVCQAVLAHADALIPAARAAKSAAVPYEGFQGPD